MTSCANSNVIRPGSQVHRWTAIERADDAFARSGRRRPLWLCRCACGIWKLVLQQNLLLALRAPVGGSRSCGCLQLERVQSHGHARRRRPSTEYMAWLAAKKRCANPRNASFPNYGGRGITMCARWSESFEAFLADIGPKPHADWSLDRIDPEQGYAPDNCHWAPPAVQARNRRNTRWYEFEGQPAVLGEVARFLGITRHQARSLERQGLLPARPRILPPNASVMGRTLVLDLNHIRPLSITHLGSEDRHA